MTEIIEHMPTAALNFVKAGRKVALATVVSTWGSAPRRIGAQLVIADDGTFLGSVSGGCVEGAVIMAAQDALKNGQCQLLEFGIADEDAFAVGLACGGDIKILIEPIGVGQGPDVAMIEVLVQNHKERQPIGYQVNIDSWSRRLIDGSDPAYTDRFVADKSGLSDDVFTLIYNPPLKMIIVGAVHISQTLTQIAKMAGYTVYLVDPRESFASKERFPDGIFIDAWPDKALTQVGLDTCTALITLTHDPKIDNPALEVALKSDAFYIGSLGSKRTHAKRVSHLKEQGFSTAEIARIHGPIGLDIGSQQPAEIAISIMAEVTERLRKPKTRP